MNRMREGRCNVEGPDGCYCLANPDRHGADHACDHQTWPNEAWTGLSIEESLIPPKERREAKKKTADGIGERTRERERAEREERKGSDLLGDALTRVGQNADGDFVTQAREALRSLVQTRELLTSEDVLDLVQAETHDNRAMGPIMLWGKSQGLIEKTEDFGTYRKPENHQMDSRIWRSLVYRSAEEPLMRDFG